MDYKDKLAMAAAYAEVVEAQKKKMDQVDKSELKGKHADRDDKDIDNDGDVDSSDEYLHKKRKAISKDMKKEETELDEKYSPSLGYNNTVKAIRTLEMQLMPNSSLAKGISKGADNVVPEFKKMQALIRQISTLWDEVERTIQMNESLDENKHLATAGTKETIMNPKTKISKKVDKAEVRKYVQQGWMHMGPKKNRITKEEVSEAEGETTPCSKCEGSTENHSADCPTQKETKSKDDTAVVSPKTDKKVEAKTEATKWQVYNRIMEKSKQTAGATAPEEMDAKESEGSKKFADMHVTPPEETVDVGKAIEKNLKTMSTDPIKHAPIRGGENRKEGK